MKRFLVLFALMAFPTLVFTQNPSEDFLGSWYTYGSSHRLSEKLSITSYGELRFYEPSSNYNLAFVSLRGNYHFKGNQSIGLGYAYLDIDTVFEFDNQPNVHEHRVFEQYVIKYNFGKFKLQHRARLEHRLLEFSNRNELQNRFRYKLSFKYSFNKSLSLVLSDESFVNFQNQVFNENRFYSGIGINILKNAQLQIGYLKQHIRKNNLNRIQIGINFKTDSRKPKTMLPQI